MLSSTCDEARTHAAIAMFHLSTTADNKISMTTMGGIARLVKLLRVDSGSDEAQRHAAGALWQLASSPDNRNAIVEAGGIPLLVELLQKTDPEGEKKAVEPMSAPTPRRRGADSISESAIMLTKETAAAVLGELARSQTSFRAKICKAGGVPPLVELMHSESDGAVKQATKTIWGLVSEPKFRPPVLRLPGAIERLVEILRKADGETQGFAAATLAYLAEEANGLDEIKGVGGAGPLITIALGQDSWLRTQCVRVLELLGYDDPAKAPSKKPEVAYTSNSTAPKPEAKRVVNRVERLLQEEKDRLNALAATTHSEQLWMLEEKKKLELVVNEEHQSDLAAKLKIGDRVLVKTSTGDSTRQAEVMFVGKIEQIAPGYWIGVQYDEPVGKNDGSVQGIRFFDCAPDHGGFLRPDKISPDPNPPPPRVIKTEEEKEKEAEEAEDASKEEKGKKAKRPPKAKPQKDESEMSDKELFLLHNPPPEPPPPPPPAPVPAAETKAPPASARPAQPSPPTARGGPAATARGAPAGSRSPTGRPPKSPVAPAAASADASLSGLGMDEESVLPL